MYNKKKTKKIINYTFTDKNFSPIAKELAIEKENNKRYKFGVSINNNANKIGKDRCLVILKNPSRAGKSDLNESDKTINTVCEYFYRQRNIINAKEIIIMNLFPLYLTDSRKLCEHKESLIDKENEKLLVQEIYKADKIVLACGHPPYKCKVKFDTMIKLIENTLTKNYFVLQHPINKLNDRYHLHGQVWGYEYQLKEITI